MLTIKVNGREEKLGIGCRTFVSLDVLLKILEADARTVTLNGETVHSREFATTTVNSGDTLKLAFVNNTL
jgi:sulfur carrier protein ThiS